MPLFVGLHHIMAFPMFFFFFAFTTSWLSKRCIIFQCFLFVKRDHPAKFSGHSKLQGRWVFMEVCVSLDSALLPFPVLFPVPLLSCGLFVVTIVSLSAPYTCFCFRNPHGRGRFRTVPLPLPPFNISALPLPLPTSRKPPRCLKYTILHFFFQKNGPALSPIFFQPGFIIFGNSILALPGGVLPPFGGRAPGTILFKAHFFQIIKTFWGIF